MTAASVDTEADTIASASKARPGKYLTFMLGKESYGIEVLKIREIIRLIDITMVPQMPEYVRGVINLRGKIIPVIDLRLKFSLNASTVSEHNCIVVVHATTCKEADSQIGLIVDAVEEVINIPGSEIEATPDFGRQVQTDNLLGIAKTKAGVKILLDIDRVLAAEPLPAFGPAEETA